MSRLSEKQSVTFVDLAKKVEIDSYKQKLLDKLKQPFDQILISDKVIQFLILVTSNDVNDIPYLYIDDLLASKKEQPARIRRIIYALTDSFTDLLLFPLHRPCDKPCDKSWDDGTIIPIDFEQPQSESLLLPEQVETLQLSLPEPYSLELEHKLTEYLETGKEQDFIKEATENKSFSFSMSSPMKESYLNIACSRGLLDCVKYLVNRGADINLVSCKSNPLDCVVRSCNMAVCNRGSSSSVKANKNVCSHFDIAKLLVERGAKPIKMKKTNVNNSDLMFIYEPHGNPLITFMQNTNYHTLPSY